MFYTEDYKLRLIGTKFYYLILAVNSVQQVYVVQEFRGKFLSRDPFSIQKYLLEDPSKYELLEKFPFRRKGGPYEC